MQKRTLKYYKTQYDALPTKNNLCGTAAMEAVEQDCYALQYVSDQTEVICLAAVKQNGYALRYVNARMFDR